MEDYNPRIYVACLAAYNNGKLFGKWIDADQDPDDILKEIKEMLKESPEPDAEEWAIHDYEEFGGFEPKELESIEDAAEMARLTFEHGEAIGLFYMNDVYDLDGLESRFEDAYAGYYASEIEYAEDLFDEIYLSGVPENIQCYIDYKSFADDLFCGDCFSLDAADGGVYVFRNY